MDFAQLWNEFVSKRDIKVFDRSDLAIEFAKYCVEKYREMAFRLLEGNYHAKD